MSKKRRLNMRAEIHQIYDKIFKRIFSLSNAAIICLINGLFGTSYPSDSTVEFLRTEYTTLNLTGKFADVYLVIGGLYHYHLEAQTDYNEHIIVRVFEYGFYHAIGTADNDMELTFPEPVVIYLKGENIPETSTITIHFGTQGDFVYQVQNFILSKQSLEELNQKKLIVLIPFYMLRLQDIIYKEPTEENFHQLQNLIQHDILDSIQINIEHGNISQDDGNQLAALTSQLYDQIYAHYDAALGGEELMRRILPGALELPSDRLEMEVERLEIEIAKQKRETEKRREEAEEQKRIATEREKENAELRERLAALQRV